MIVVTDAQQRALVRLPDPAPARPGGTPSPRPFLPTAPRWSGGGVTDTDLHAVDVLLIVRERLEAAGAHRELLRLSRMSSDELRILVDREVQQWT